MSGTGTQRHCAACDRDVLDLSAMPPVAAIDALIARDGRACIRYRTDAAGEIQFAAPPRRSNPIAIAALALTACAGWSDDPATISPDELGQCIPDADAPNQCDLPDAPPRPPPPLAPTEPTPPTKRDYTAQTDVTTSRDFTALVEVAPTATGDSGVRVEDLQRMRSELTTTPTFGDVETTIVQGNFEDSPTLETSLFNRESTASDTGVRLGMMTAEPRAITGPADQPDFVHTRADLRRMRRELRREERHKRRRG